jgi:S-adenosyl methyltransferase
MESSAIIVAAVLLWETSGTRAEEDLVSEAGIRQFLDIGTGLPAANNVHQVAQSL